MILNPNNLSFCSRPSSETKPANGRAHRTQTTFATQPTILRRSGAARLLGERMHSQENNMQILCL